jgi:hypothetical protein
MLPPIMLEDGSRTKECGEFTVEDLRRVANAVLRNPGSHPVAVATAREKEPRRILPGEGGVYFVGAEEGPVKIGFSRDFHRRLAALQAASPVELRLLAVIVDASPVIERNYHSRFGRHRLHGEWFERSPEIMAEIERLKS